MKDMNKKLREARTKLGLSQDYVGKAIGIGRSAITQIEQGNRKVSAEELEKFCRFYRLSADYFLGTTSLDTNQAIFARNFEELTENDQQEVLNLIQFKKAMAAQLGGSNADR